MTTRRRLHRQIGCRWPRTAVTTLLALAVITAGPTLAASERSRQKQAAEAQRTVLQQKLTALKKAIDSTESAKNQAADALAASERAISDANRSLHDLAEEQSRTEDRLAILTRQLRDLQAQLAARKKELTGLLREQYVAGNEDRIKLLLSGDDPSRINRMLRYLGYASTAQGKLIAALQTNLRAIEANQAEAREASADLADIATESRAQKTLLEQEKTQRAQLLARYANRLESQRAEAGRLQRDESRLGGLVRQLDRIIAEQQKADAEARAKEQREQRQRKERQQQALLAQRAAKAAAAKAAAARPPVAGLPPAVSAGAARPNPDAIDADEAPPGSDTKILARNEPSTDSDVSGVTSPMSLVPFDSLKGRLRLPVKGDLVARFGMRREGGPNWKGLFISAAEGSEVRAVAAGRVVFADWLRGFGNLIIIDHGTQYLTIYGNNQATLKHAGDRVGSGEVIASAGNTGGNQQSGLYFEMRYQGRAIDPLGWITSR